MAGSRTEAVRRRARRRRIKRLEKLFSVVMIAAFFAPAVLCVFLMIKTAKLETEIEELKKQTEAVVTQLQEEKQTVSVLQQKLEAEQQTQNDLQDFDIENDVEPEIEEPDTISEEDADEAEKMRNVYLTFDDGPSIYTNKILDILKEYDIKATFFVTGKDEPEYTELYQRIVEEGHTLGLHSYSHNYSELYASTERFINDFEKRYFCFCLISIISRNEFWGKHAFRFCAGDDTIIVSKCTMLCLTK